MNKNNIYMEEMQIIEEDVAFTPEQLDRIEQLRKERDKTPLPAFTCGGMYKPWEPSEGDLVKVHLEGTEFIGKISKVRAVSKWEKYYNVNTPHGILKDLTKGQIRERSQENLSGVEAPEALKNLPARKLLALLRSTYGPVYNWNRPEFVSNHAFYEGVEYTALQIKAALVGKEHIPNKREIQKVNAHKRKFSKS